VGAVAWIGLFLPQLLAARYAQSRPRKKPWALLFGGGQRVTVLLAAVAVFAWGGAPLPQGLVAFFVAFALIQVLTGVATPGWFELFAKLTPVHLRGRLTGLRSAIGGGLGAVCAGILSWILATVGFPSNYALAFLCAFALQGASIVLQFWLVEATPSPVVPLAPVRGFLGQIISVLRENAGFRRFLLGCVLLMFASVPAGFITVYALEEMRSGEAAVGAFTAILFIAQVASAPVMGLLADRRGNRIVLALAAAASLIASVTAFVAPSSPVLAVAFAFVGVNLGSEIMARQNMAVEFAPPAERALYLGLMNSLLGPLYLLGLAGGVLVNAMGFRALFLAGAASAAAALMVFLYHVHEPRTTTGS
jgi:MFS family permease